MLAPFLKGTSRRVVETGSGETEALSGERLGSWQEGSHFTCISLLGEMAVLGV
jgi:hypothetical protein